MVKSETNVNARVSRRHIWGKDFPPKLQVGPDAEVILEPETLQRFPLPSFPFAIFN